MSSRHEKCQTCGENHIADHMIYRGVCYFCSIKCYYKWLDRQKKMINPPLMQGELPLDLPPSEEDIEGLVRCDQCHAPVPRKTLIVSKRGRFCSEMCADEDALSRMRSVV